MKRRRRRRLKRRKKQREEDWGNGMQEGMCIEESIREDKCTSNKRSQEGKKRQKKKAERNKWTVGNCGIEVDGRKQMGDIVRMIQVRDKRMGRQIGIMGAERQGKAQRQDERL